MRDLRCRVDAFAERLISFERTYRNIFGSQLEALGRANAHGISEEELKNVFQRYKDAMPDIHGKRTFEQWLGFLRNDGLIQLPRWRGRTSPPSRLRGRISCGTSLTNIYPFTNRADLRSTRGAPIGILADAATNCYEIGQFGADPTGPKSLFNGLF